MHLLSGEQKLSREIPSAVFLLAGIFILRCVHLCDVWIDLDLKHADYSNFTSEIQEAKGYDLNN
jgi:hypothetical protein